MRLLSSAIILTLLMAPAIAIAAPKAPDCTQQSGKLDPACAQAKPVKAKQPAKPNNASQPVKANKAGLSTPARTPKSAVNAKPHKANSPATAKKVAPKKQGKKKKLLPLEPKQ